MTVTEFLRMSKVVPLLALTAVCLTGCPERPEPDPAPEVDYRKRKTEAPSKKKKPIKRTSMAGNWAVRVVVLTRRGQMLVNELALIGIDRAGDGYKARLLSVPQHLRDLQVTEAKITQTTAHIVLKGQRAVLNFEVALDGSVARGTGDVGEWVLMPVEFVATNATQIPFGDPRPHPSQSDPELSRISPNDDKAMRAYLDKHPKSEVAYFNAMRLWLGLVTSTSKKRSTPEIRKDLKEMERLLRPWGPRAGAYWRFQVARALLEIARTAPEVVVEIGQDIKSSRYADYVNARELDDLITLGTVEVNCEKALSAKDAAVRQKAIAALEEAVEDRFRFMGITTYRLAQAYRRAGQDGKALQLYGRLLATPAMEAELAGELQSRGDNVPKLRKEFEELWAKQKRDKAKIEAFLTSAYRTAMRDMDLDVVAPRPDQRPRRTVVCELSANCDAAFAVAPDLALAAVVRSYPDARIIPLRYHLELPAEQDAPRRPDPLTCNDAAGRALGRQVTSLFVNGRLVPEREPLALWSVRNRQRIIRAMIASELARPADYRIDLTGNIKGNTLAYQAKVTGPKEIPADMRVVVVLAEDRIDYTGENRIRRHAMVVRAVPTNDEPLTASQATIRKTVDLKKLSSEIRDYLKRYEEQQNITLPFKPIRFRDLHVVAMVENKRTGEIFQAASIRVGAPAESPKSATTKKQTPGK